MKRRPNKKSLAPKTKTLKYYFFNQGKQYLMLVTAPDTVIDYKVKEIFDGNFVGKKEAINFNPDIFKTLNEEIEYSVTEI